MDCEFDNWDATGRLMDENVALYVGMHSAHRPYLCDGCKVRFWSTTTLREHKADCAKWAKHLVVNPPSMKTACEWSQDGKRCGEEFEVASGELHEHVCAHALNTKAKLVG